MTALTGLKKFIWSLHDRERIGCCDHEFDIGTSASPKFKGDIDPEIANSNRKPFNLDLFNEEEVVLKTNYNPGRSEPLQPDEARS